MVRHILTYITNSVTDNSQQQGNIPRNVWMPCQGKAAMLFWVKLTCCLRERKISMKVQLYLQRWTPLRHSWVNHVFRAVGLLRSRLTVIFLHNSRRLLPAPITPQTRPASLSLIAEQFPFVFNKITQHFSAHPSIHFRVTIAHAHHLLSGSVI